MTKHQYKPGVHAEYLVTRRLKLVGFDPEEATAIVRELDVLPGVGTTSFDPERAILKVSYDASVTSVDRVEAVLQKHGCDVSQQWWSRFKEGWYRTNDANIRDNSQHEPWSCHKLPPARRNR